MDGALLRCLAALFPQGLIGEIGTGPGVSASWLLSGMGKNARLITCEIDARLASLATEFFADRQDVEIRHGDWRAVLGSVGPFDLLFFDADAQAVLANRERWADVLRLLRIGGILVMDDLFPVEMWPDEWKGQTDHKREFCLRNPRVAGAEVRTSATTVSILATRMS